jgi:L-rhamnose mutarotase
MRVAFKMKLNNGFEEEYKKRHDELWPELQTLLKKTGIKDYSIFLDEGTNFLFAYLTIDDVSKLDDLPGETIMKKWWNYMKDIMETNEDGSPKSISLKEVFYLE